MRLIAGATLNYFSESFISSRSQKKSKDFLRSLLI